VRGGSVDVAPPAAPGRIPRGTAWTGEEFGEVLPRLVAELGGHEAQVT
jgi:hypothetical protein